nr:flippase-like domain-containing protein [Chloroflexota bacterium]
FTLMLLAVATLFIPTRAIASVPLLKIGLLAGALALLAAAWLMFMPAKQAALAAKVRSLRVKKLRSMLDAFTAFQQRRDVLAKGLGLSFIQQANVVFFYYLLAWGLELPIPLSSFCLIAPLAIFLMLLPISINAIGLRENIFVFFFAAFGVSTAEAVAFAWLVYGLAIVQALLGGLIYALSNAQTIPSAVASQLRLDTAPSEEHQLR